MADSRYSRSYNPKANPVNYLTNVGQGWYDSATDLVDMVRRPGWERDAAVDPYTVPDFVPSNYKTAYANALLQQRNEGRNALATLRMKEDRRTMAKYPGSEGYEVGNALSYAIDPVGDMMGGPLGAMAAKGISALPWERLAMAIPKKIQDVTEYGISHRPMTIEGGAANIYDLTPAFGEDIYGKNALQYFGSGDPREKEVLGVLARIRNNPNAKVTIYRGVPKGTGGKINSGDWVTLSPSVAKDYGDEVLKTEVPASDVTGWSDSLLEFGYYPKANK